MSLIFFKIEECENLTRRNTVCISRTKVTAGEAEVAAHNLSMTMRLEKITISGQALGNNRTGSIIVE